MSTWSFQKPRKGGEKKQSVETAAGVHQVQHVPFIVAWQTTEAQQEVKQIVMCVPGGSAERNTN